MAPEDNPADDVQPTAAEYDAAMTELAATAKKKFDDSTNPERDAPTANEQAAGMTEVPARSGYLAVLDQADKPPAKERRKPTVCVDLDGTLAEYDGWKGVEHIGPPRPGAKQFMAMLRFFARVVVFTTRCKVEPFPGGGERASVGSLHDLVQGWLVNNGIEHDEIYCGQGKPIAVAYVDDRSVKVPTNPHAIDFEIALAEVKKLMPKG